MVAAKISSFKRRLPLIMLVGVVIVASVFAVSTVLGQDGEGEKSGPDKVVLAGTFQSELGCTEDWQPDCDATQMTYNEEAGIWLADFRLEAGDYEYKVAINGSWDENYGAKAESYGENITFSLSEATKVIFLFDYKTKWITDDANTPIVTVVGDFQEEAGCASDWAIECLKHWLQDPDGNGVYVFSTADIPEGNWEAKAVLNQSFQEVYGQDGEKNGLNIPFSIPASGSLVTFEFDAETNLLSVLTFEAPAFVAVPAEGEGEGDEAAPVEEVVVQPDNVSVPGTIQSVLGCPGDWQPECDVTQLTFDSVSGLWLGEFELPAGSYEYKVAINNAWDENYGGRADAGGPNVALVLESDTTVKFIYDHRTKWIADSVNSLILTAPGDYTNEIGCPGDWAPECLVTWLQDPDGDGVYVFTTGAVPPGEWQVKVAVNQTWDLSYGLDGASASGSPNIPFTIPDDGGLLTVSFDSAASMPSVTVGEGGGVAVVPTEPSAPVAVVQPDNVSVPGTINSVIGCAGDWQPDCEQAQMTFDEADQLWQVSFDLPAGSYEYKVAINKAWDENYGGRADPGGPNVPLVLAEDGTVKFVYDHATNWIADSVNSFIANVPGNFQDEIGCPGEWQPDCLRSWLQDPDGDGLYVFTTTAIPAGTYEAKVAINESWDENYGAEGAPGGANITFEVPEDGTEVYFGWNSESKVLTISAAGAPRGSLGLAQARWVAADTITWDIDAPEGSTFSLHYAADATLALEPGGITGGEMLTLTVDPNGPSEAVLAQFPHLAGHLTLKLSEEDLAKVPAILKGQIAVAATDPEGKLIDATALQIPGVLDDLFFYDGPLGATFDGQTPTIRVWAPTAQNVTFHLFEDSSPETTSTTFPMTYDDSTGVWTVTGEADWYGKFYLFEVDVYVRTEAAIAKNIVTDPYSVSLSMNSQRSQIIDMLDPALMPEGWADLEKPVIEAPEDIVLYELHVRDFSIRDESVAEELRGTFAAFTQSDSAGMQHLRALAEAGLTHIHLLPSFDIATINENPAERVEPDWETLAGFGPNSDEQWALIDPLRDQDGFNWGYDPYHFNVPEGSYSTNADGTQRILEFREMVMALNQNGLNVVMDVVYNHTNSSGQGARSVFDKIVPGYYHRLTNDGAVATSTCCANTATEHKMMEKFMVDSIVFWTTAYKVDGYRFDLMGHHMRTNMEAVRAALDGLTVEESGVDGQRVYVYGEGWNFGEVADNARGVNATQLNLGGTGIGTFNDRLRDAARGGSPFGGQVDQGFATGLFTDPNGLTAGDEAAQEARLLLFTDQIMVGLAGNLRDYQFESHTGEVVSGADVDYNGSPAGYTLDPQEHIIYVEAHDNETFFDIVQYKAPAAASVAERVRMQNLGISITMLSQGVPFFHAGQDMLRSKSFDKNSYNSGDWYNAIDWTYQSNNWAIGLPPNRDTVTIIEPLLANPDIAPTQADILANVAHFREMLQIRQSTPLFRLRSAEDVFARLQFHNTGPDMMRGVIVMSISDMVEGMDDLDAGHELVVVVFNANPGEISFTEEALTGLDLQLHPIQVGSSDTVVQSSSFDSATGTLTVPGRTTAVFVLAE